MCRGVMENLAGMMGPEMLRLRGIQRIVGSGACLIRNAEIIETESRPPIALVVNLKKIIAGP